MSEESIKPFHKKNKNSFRKKHKSFVDKAKNYAKRGQLGPGERISDELLQYFVGILDVIRKGIEDDDEKESLVNNVLERTKGEELNVVGNKIGSRLIETLLPYSSAEDLERYIEIASTDLRRLCSDSYASHFIETLLNVCAERATEHLQNNNQEDEVPKKKRKTESKYTQEHINNCCEMTLKICKYALNNLEDFVWDVYANHILRSALKCLSGIKLLPNEQNKQKLKMGFGGPKIAITPHTKNLEYKNVPDEFKELVKEFSGRLSSWPQFKDLPFQSLTSGLLQTILFALKNVDKKLTKNLIKRLLDESLAPDDWVSNANGDEKKDSKDEKIDVDELENPDNQKDNQTNLLNGKPLLNNLPPVFNAECSVRLLEAALFVAKEKTYTQIYAKCFINRLGQLATMRNLNFTVQRLLDNCRLKEEFEPMFEELSAKFPDILAAGNSGVLLALCKACVKLQAKQKQFIQHLCSALKCESSDQEKWFPILCLQLKPADKVDKIDWQKNFMIHIHGSVILQTIMEFQRPAIAVNNLLALSADELSSVMCDSRGSHLVDALTNSVSAGVKARERLTKKMRGQYQKLALSQYGSRALDKIFEASAIELKVKIMEELSDKNKLLNSTKFGTIMAAKLDVATFVKSRKEWENKFANKKAVTANVDDGQYQKLALSQYGSRALDKIFEASAIELKVKIMEELSDKNKLLNSTKFGTIMAAKLDVATFVKSRKEWENKFANKKAVTANVDDVNSE